MVSSFIGALMISLSMDNVSKIIKSGLGKDKWNVEEESFMQPTTKVESPSTVNIPMQFYHKGKVYDGWINIPIYRSLICLGIPGSGKTYSILTPLMRTLIHKSWTLVAYDIKFPDLGKIAYYHYRLAKQQGKCEGFNFHMINLTDVEKSRRVNPWRSDYFKGLADASETAEGLVEALKKSDKSGGADQFFTQSAINFLASCVYFFSKYSSGKYSSVPHVLSFLNCSYDEIFQTLFSEPELASLLSPFKSAYKLKAYDQLEGQIGTLKIFISRLATKETFWVFSGDDFELKVSSPKDPSILILANDPLTQSVSSTCYSIVINRLTKLINTKGNLPVALIMDEIPTIYIYKIENLLATARSNKVSVIMGLQELPMFRQQYGKDAADTIVSVVGNVISGAVRNKDTLDWLSMLFGKSKQKGESLNIDRNKTSSSINEKMEALIPAGKIASLNSGEVVGLLTADAQENYTGKFESLAIHCKVNLDVKKIQEEESHYTDLPVYYDFGDKKYEILMENFNRINAEVEHIVSLFSVIEPDPSPGFKKGSMKNQMGF